MHKAHKARWLSRRTNYRNVVFGGSGMCVNRPLNAPQPKPSSMGPPDQRMTYRRAGHNPASPWRAPLSALSDSTDSRDGETDERLQGNREAVRVLLRPGVVDFWHE